MNPGDWENCVPQNIKIFETIYNPVTKENVVGSFAKYTVGRNRLIIYAGVMQNSDYNFAQCLEIDPVLGSVINRSGGKFNTGGEGYFSFPANLSSQNYRITKINNSNITGPGNVQVVRFSKGPEVAVGNIVNTASNQIYVEKKNLSFSLYSVIEMEAVE